MKKLINLEKKEILLPLRDGEIESYNYQKFCCICKNKFDKVHDHDVSNGDSDDNDDDVFDTRKFHGDVIVPDIDVDDQDEEWWGIWCQTSHDNAVEPDIDVDVDDCDDDDDDDDDEVFEWYEIS